MNSQHTSIYQFEELTFTLAWLTSSKNDSAKETVNRAIIFGLISIHKKKLQRVNGRKVLKLIKKRRVIFSDFNKIEDLTKILIGLGELSAWSNEDFIDSIKSLFSRLQNKRVLLKVLTNVLRKKELVNRKRSLEEISHFQQIKKFEFDAASYKVALRSLEQGRRIATFSYGFEFIAKLCIKLIPGQFSTTVQRYKDKAIVQDLCKPVLEGLMFRDNQYINSLLKGKNSYLKLLAAASLVNQQPFDTQSSIEENIKTLTAKGINKGDAIWLVIIKWVNRHQKVERIKDNIKSLKHELYLCKKDHSNCPKGTQPQQWIESRSSALKATEESLISSETNLQESLNDLKNNWPKEKLSECQVNNIVDLVSDKKLLIELTSLVTSLENKTQVLEYLHSSFKNWVGITSKPIIEAWDRTFSYTAQTDLEQVSDLAQVVISLSGVKGKDIGRFLGSEVGKSVSELESLICIPYLSVRKPNLWNSAVARLASIHLLAICIFKQTPSQKEKQISTIVPHVMEKISLLLKVKNTPYYTGNEVLFSDLKRLSAHVFSIKTYLSSSASQLVLDDDLPIDYRAMVLVSNKELLIRHKELLLQLFDEFCQPQIHPDYDNHHFTQSLNLLDICIANCWKFEKLETAHNIIQIWEKVCKMYESFTIEYVGYAKKLHSALIEDGQDRKWLKRLIGFENSNCLIFLQNSLEALE